MNPGLSIALFVLTSSLAIAAGQPFVSLFDGKTLNGWEVCNGFAKYEVVDAAIVGQPRKEAPIASCAHVRSSATSFSNSKRRPIRNLTPASRFVPTGMRGAKVKTFDGKTSVDRIHPAGRVYGYQVEIANEKSGTSGGIYEEAARGWLSNISSDPSASKAFKDDQWNRFRVIAKGDSIKTFINGVPCADLVDSTQLTGFIALQVHQYKGPKPAQVRWRNIRIQDMGRHTR